ncbi:MAG: hypothetical protein ACPH7H_06900 [Porticoccaceae bacterium]
MSKKLFFADDHESLFEKIFPMPAPEGLDQYELEELNPQDAEQVAEFDSEVNGFATSWVNRCFYYVCSIPSELACYCLFSIDYDDNYGTWKRCSLGAVRGPTSHHNASKVLLKKFAQENIETAGGGEWKEFLEELMTNE